MQPNEKRTESWLPLAVSLSIGIAIFLWFVQFKNDNFQAISWLAYPFALYGLWNVPKAYGDSTSKTIQKWLAFGALLLTIATIRRLEPTLSATIEIFLLFILGMLALFHDWFTYEGKKAFYSIFVAMLWCNALAPLLFGPSMPQFVGRGEKFVLVLIAFIASIGFVYMAFVAKPSPSSAVQSKPE